MKGPTGGHTVIRHERGRLGGRMAAGPRIAGKARGAASYAAPRVSSGGWSLCGPRHGGEGWGVEGWRLAVI